MSRQTQENHDDDSSNASLILPSIFVPRDYDVFAGLDVDHHSIAAGAICATPSAALDQELNSKARGNFNAGSADALVRTRVRSARKS